MKLLVHMLLITGVFVGSDFALEDGRNTQAIIRDPAPMDVLGPIRREARLIGSAISRQMVKLVE